MAQEDGATLIEGLPMQLAPQRSSVALPRLRTANRRQVMLRAVDLESLVAEEHRLRLVWSFVAALDLAPLYNPIKAVEGRPGHPPADPRILLALWLYATVQGVGSARELARLCEEHIAFQWLCGGVGMNAKTLADFRVDLSAALEQLLIDSFAALLKIGAAKLDRVAQDGVRVRAAAGAASFRRHATLEVCRQEAEDRVRQLRAQLERDPSAASRRQVATRQRAADDRARRVKEALAVTETLRAQQQERARQRAKREARKSSVAQTDAAKSEPPKQETRTDKEPRASTTDAEARVMKMADGGFRPAYNVQFVSDTTSGAIAGVAVDNSGSDMGKMAPMSEALAAQYGQRAGEYLADGGYAKLDDIKALAAAGVTAYVPVPTPRDKTRDPHAAQQADAPAIADWRERMGTEQAKEIYKERAATAECSNAQARNRGLRQFMVRGLDKVRSVALWHGLTHNMVLHMASGGGVIPARRDCHCAEIIVSQRRLDPIGQPRLVIVSLRTPVLYG
jgi:transposase